MSAYYNEFDPFTAAWLRELIKRGLIADGEVDERSITDVHPDDLHGFTQCHFFAGIGGWSLALRLVGWQDAKPAWTASLPCQPWSLAGPMLGELDERHLFPVFLDLVRQRRPSVVFGEQVKSKDALRWLDGVQDGMEALGYAFGATSLCSAGFACHERQRLHWVAASDTTGFRGPGLEPSECFEQVRQRGPRSAEDLQAVLDGPYLPGARWSQPLLRAGDDGISERVAGCLAAGNAIVPETAAHFIAAFMEARP